MNNNLLKLRSQELLNKGKPDEAMNLIFNAYMEAHPETRNLGICRDKVGYKLRTEFNGTGPNEVKNCKALVNAFLHIIGPSDGDTAFSLILLLLHLLRKGHSDAIAEAVELIKIERASNNLNAA